jgi:hypothetical protein
VYESTELDARMEVVVRDKKLYVGDVGDCDLEILRIARDRFGASGLTFDFVRDEAGATTGFKAGSGRMRNVWFARVTR